MLRSMTKLTQSNRRLSAHLSGIVREGERDVLAERARSMKPGDHLRLADDLAKVSSRGRVAISHAGLGAQSTRLFMPRRAKATGRVGIDLYTCTSILV